MMTMEANTTGDVGVGIFGAMVGVLAIIDANPFRILGIAAKELALAKPAKLSAALFTRWEDAQTSKLVATTVFLHSGFTAGARLCGVLNLHLAQYRFVGLIAGCGSCIAPEIVVFAA